MTSSFGLFRSALEDGIDLPCDAFVIGEPVSVVELDYDGNLRRGLVARCTREDSSEHRVSASEVVLAEQSDGGNLIAAYRKWSGLDPWREQAAPPPRRKRQHKVAATDLDLSGPIELVVLSVKTKHTNQKISTRKGDIAAEIKRYLDGERPPGAVRQVRK